MAKILFVGDVPCPTVADLAYAAGIIDGEGCLTIQNNIIHHKRRRHPTDKTTYSLSLQLSVNNTDPRLGLYLLNIFGVGSVTDVPARRSTYRPQTKWHVFRQQAIVRILYQVRPYLVLKGEHADLLIELQALKDQSVAGHHPTRYKEERQLEILRRIREVNRRGV